MIWCDYKDVQGIWCGLPAIKDCRCHKHLGKESKVRRVASPRFRGDSKWQLEQGLGKSKTGSHA